MKNFIILLIFIASSFGTNLFACSCAQYLSFCEGVNTDSKIMEVEVLAKYSGTAPTTYMDIKIVASLQGTVVHDKLTVISYGTSCDVFFDNFAIGEKLVVTFSDLEAASALVNYPNFTFRACSLDYLRLSNNELTGLIEPNVSSKNYDDFKNDIGACADLSLFDRGLESLNEHIRVFSNPTPDLAYITTWNLDPTQISFELYNASGQLITAANTNSSAQNSIPLDLSGMAVGVYFLRIKYKDLKTVIRVVKM